ncbi:MAG: HPr family phosphocarrier protein [Clostridium sp.]|nr:HPr family phosphocarrier protein [Clostridium sp.]
MVGKKIKVKKEAGLDAKAAALFIQKASGFKSNVWIEKDERKANGKSLLGILALEIGFGSMVTLTADGRDEDEAVEVLSGYLAGDCRGND